MSILSPDLARALNEQMCRELFNANQYTQVASYFNALGFPSIEDHFLKQAEDERSHAKRFYDLITDTLATLVVDSIPAPITKFANPVEVAKAILDLELFTNDNITALMKLASGNYIVQSKLWWFAEEQVSEVNEADQFLRAVQAANGNLHFVVEWLEHAK